MRGWTERDTVQTGDLPKAAATRSSRIGFMQ
jgi:hypothetical protein